MVKKTASIPCNSFLTGISNMGRYMMLLNIVNATDAVKAIFVFSRETLCIENIKQNKKSNKFKV
jgi:hypothetical protein